MLSIMLCIYKFGSKSCLIYSSYVLLARIAANLIEVNDAPVFLCKWKITNVHLVLIVTFKNV